MSIGQFIIPLAGSACYKGTSCVFLLLEGFLRIVSMRIADSKIWDTTLALGMAPPSIIQLNIRVRMFKSTCMYVDGAAGE